MNLHPSLARRTVVYLVVSQFAAFLIGWAITVALGLAGVNQFTTSWDEMAATRVSRYVVASLGEGRNGQIEIRPTPALIAEMKRTPALRFAAFDFTTKQPVPGSAPELVKGLEKVIDVSSTHAHFTLPGDSDRLPLGFMEPELTRFGRLHIATYRQKFRWDDILYSIEGNFAGFSWFISAALVLSVGAAWFAVKRALIPVSAAATTAAQIDLDSLDQRLPCAGVPAEIAPLVDAINAALSRLDAGVARQRRFTANAAHELRTPLAIMRARLENAKSSPLRNELLGDASQLRSIVEEMLVAARLTEGQLELDQPVDLKAVVAQTVTALMPLAMDRERFIDFQADPETAIVIGNPRAIECVLTNLIDNALRAEPDQGSVLARVSGASVSINDHGAGVAMEDRDAIFEPFWRKHDTTSGAGLGLAIAREIMEAHGGRIRVDDTPGGGATFTLAFRLFP